MTSEHAAYLAALLREAAGELTGLAEIAPVSYLRQRYGDLARRLRLEADALADEALAE